MRKINVGIDFGTTNSVAVIYLDGVPELVKNKEGKLTTPSVVSYDKVKGWDVGQSAKNNWIINPYNTVYSIKRIIGKRIEDIPLSYSYQLKNNSEGNLRVILDDMEFSSEEVASKIISYLLSAVSSNVENIGNVVVSIPAKFNHLERKSLMKALRIAGIKDANLINEPTAASIFYSYLYPDRKENILVFDMGGGTLDISFVKINNNEFNVIGTFGDNYLGGDDLDEEIIDFISDNFLNIYNIDLRLIESSYVRLKMEVEKAKIKLSYSDNYDFILPYICTRDTENLHLQDSLTKEKFEKLITPYTQRINEISKNALRLIGISKTSIDKVLLVGGATNIPLIRKTVKNIFNKPVVILDSPEILVALGACIYSEILSENSSTNIKKKKKVYDILPFSIGIQTDGGLFNEILPANSKLPFTAKEIYSTATDNQPSVEVCILQGGKVKAKDNLLIGKFILDGIPPAPRGIPQIEISFTVDKNGMFSISATNKGTGKSHSLTIEGINE